MTMKTRFYLMVLLAAAAVPACKKNQIPDTTGSEQAININTSIDALTKSPQLDADGKGSFSAGDVFSLAVADSRGQKALFDYTVGSTQLHWTDISFSAEAGRLDFYACYPKQDLSGGSFTFNISDASEKDLLVARAAGVSQGTDGTIEMSFRHLMHRLVINYTIEDESFGQLDEISTVCTANSECSVELPDFRISVSVPSKAEFTGTGNTVSFLLLPQSASEIGLKVSAGDISEEFVLSDFSNAPESLNSGEQLTVDVTLKDGKIVLGNTVIEGWGDQGTIGGEIIL